MSKLNNNFHWFFLLCGLKMSNREYDQFNSDELYSDDDKIENPNNVSHFFHYLYCSIIEFYC